MALKHRFTRRDADALHARAVAMNDTQAQPVLVPGTYVITGVQGVNGRRFRRGSTATVTDDGGIANAPGLRLMRIAGTCTSGRRLEMCLPADADCSAFMRLKGGR